MSIMPLEMRLNATCAATSLRMEPKFSEGGGVYPDTFLYLFAFVNCMGLYSINGVLNL